MQIPRSSFKLAILVVTSRKMNTLVVFGENKLANKRVTFKRKLINSTKNTVNAVNTISSLKRSSDVLVPEM